jgi:hypothetical protein
MPTEMLAEGRGRIVPFSDPEAMAEQIIDLLDNDVERHAIRKKAYTFTREAVWKEVARKYLQVFSEVSAKTEPGTPGPGTPTLKTSRPSRISSSRRSSYIT